MFRSEQIQKILSSASLKLLKELEANKIVVVERVKKENSEELIDKLKTTILTKSKKQKNFFYMEFDEAQTIESKIKDVVIRAIKLKFLENNSRVILVFDENIQTEFYTGILVIDVSKVLYRIAKFRLTEYLENSVLLEKILRISEEIRDEGREGKKIGTLFVIGDEKELEKYLRPLILNPFYGYPESMRDVLNNDLSDTIKEYSQLDGAFIINNKGILISAGTYLDVDTKDVKKYLGWGTRHLAAVAITEKTNSVAVLISESGGKIKIFKKGKLMLKI